MNDIIGLLGVLLAVAGTIITAHAMLSMRSLVNSTRPEGQKITSFFLLPGSTRPVSQAMKAEHPGHPLLKRMPIGMALIVVGLVIMTATNSHNANHS